MKTIYDLKPTEGQMEKHIELLIAMNTLTVNDFFIEARVLRINPNHSMMWKWVLVKAENELLMMVPVPHPDEDTGNVTLHDSQGHRYEFTEEEAAMVMFNFTTMTVSYLVEVLKQSTRNVIVNQMMDTLMKHYSKSGIREKIDAVSQEIEESSQMNPEFYLRMRNILD